MSFSKEVQGVREYTLMVQVIIDDSTPVADILAKMEEEARDFPVPGMVLLTETYELTVTAAWEAGKRKPQRNAGD